MSFQIKRILRKVTNSETTEDIVNDITSSLEFEFESKLRKLGFRKINDNCNKLGIMFHSGTNAKMKLHKTLKKLSIAEIKKFTNDKKPYSSTFPKNPPIYFYYGNFFVSLCRGIFGYTVYYITDDGIVSNITDIIDMNIEEVYEFLGDLNDSNIKSFSRGNKIEKILKDDE